MLVGGQDGKVEGRHAAGIGGQFQVGVAEGEEVLDDFQVAGATEEMEGGFAFVILGVDGVDPARADQGEDDFIGGCKVREALLVAGTLLAAGQEVEGRVALAGGGADGSAVENEFFADGQVVGVAGVVEGRPQVVVRLVELRRGGQLFQQQGDDEEVALSGGQMEDVEVVGVDGVEVFAGDFSQQLAQHGQVGLDDGGFDGLFGELGLLALFVRLGGGQHTVALMQRAVQRAGAGRLSGRGLGAAAQIRFRGGAIPLRQPGVGRGHFRHGPVFAPLGARNGVARVHRHGGGQVLVGGHGAA